MHERPRRFCTQGVVFSVVLATFVAGVMVGACGPSSSGARSAAGANLHAAKFAAPPGVMLVSACTPTGPEMCFNAVDDNCNGIIDEGCGVCTGPLQFMVSWGDSPADVDLIVTDPTGARVFEGNRATSAGLRLDHDCPSEGCSGQNIENICFEGGDPPRGRYVMEVKLADLHAATAPVRVRFGARVGSHTYGADVALSQNDDRKTFSFEL